MTSPSRLVGRPTRNRWSCTTIDSSRTSGSGTNRLGSSRTVQKGGTPGRDTGDPVSDSDVDDDNDSHNDSEQDEEGAPLLTPDGGVPWNSDDQGRTTDTPARQVGGPRVDSGTNCLFSISDALRSLRNNVTVQLSAAGAVPRVRFKEIQRKGHTETPTQTPPTSPPLGVTWRGVA